MQNLEEEFASLKSSTGAAINAQSHAEANVIKLDQERIILRVLYDNVTLTAD